MVSFLHIATFLSAASLIHGHPQPIPAGTASVSVRANGDGYYVDVDHVDEDEGLTSYKLNLVKREVSVFAPDFQYQVHGVNEDGVDEISVRNDVMEGVKDVYVDDKHAAAVHIGENGEISGNIGDLHIKPSGNGDHSVSRTKRSINGPTTDAIDIPRDLIDLPTRRALTVATPEVLVLLDVALYRIFGNNDAAVRDYLSVFFNGVNRRFGTITEASIQIQLTGFRAFTSMDAQTFIRDAKINGADAYDMEIVLDKLSYWVKANKASLGAFDAVALMTAEKYMSLEGNTYQEGIAGIAYLHAACWDTPQQYLGVSVNSDRGSFEGVHTLTHELGHNLNAPHDPQDSSSSGWNMGYIMSYLGDGTRNKYLWSPNSKQQMIQFLNTDGAACTRSKQFTGNNGIAPTSNFPGDKINMDVQCQRSLNKATAKFYNDPKSPATVCLNMKCLDGNSIWTMNRAPLDNSACGTNKVCKNGDCVAR